MATLATPAGPEIALYIHWPFCKSKCPYCDFNSHVAAAIDHDLWQKSYLAEIDAYAERLGQASVKSIFFGGGTPSLMAPETVAAILQRARHHWSFTDNIEITLEANPTSVEADKFKNLRQAGINRLSLGVQSLRADVLQFLGREHTAQEARQALDLGRKTFPRFSFDLIYARPGQTAKDWKKELAEALKLAGDHLSLYQLTIEPGTRFHKDRVPAMDGDAGADLYRLTQTLMTAAGLPAYEVSNHARPGEESRHNMVYWQGGNYIGIGPGAHGRGGVENTWIATQNWRDPDKWLEAVAKSGTGLQKTRDISKQERADELLMMGLRLTRGLDATLFKERSGQSLPDCLDPKGLQQLSEGGLLTWDGQTLKATEEGLLCLDGVLARLLT